MAQAKNGDTVKVHYTGELEDGTVFDSSTDRDPIEFTIGDNQLIPGFEEAVIGMSQGDSKTAVVEAEKAYGEHQAQLVIELGRENFADQTDPEVGQYVQLKRSDGFVLSAQVTQVTEAGVVLDANHPLAGEDLTFKIELVEIV
jgi:peptidylprolyl isomerase